MGDAHTAGRAAGPPLPAPPARTGHARFVLRGWMLPAAVLLLYAFPFPHFEVLNSPNELSRLYQVRAVVDDGSLAVNGPVQRFGPVGDLSQVDGRLYPNKAPGIVFLGVPVYAALRAVRGDAAQVPNRALLWFLRLTLCALPTVLLLRPLRRHAARLCGDAAAADAAVLCYALGTLAFPYSLLYFSHQISAVLAAGAFLLLARARDGSPKVALLETAAGAFAGLAVLCEYTLAPVAAVLAVYGVATAPARWAALGRIAAGAAPFALALGAYHQAAFGSPFTPSYAHVQNAVFASWHAQGFMGVSVPRLSSLVGNLFSPARGLFAFSPALLLALPGLWLAWRRDRADALVATAVTAFYFFIAAAFLYEAWGWMLGPRHLTPLAPFLAAPLACAIARARERSAAASGVAAGLVAASIVFNGLSSAVYPHIPEEFGAAFAHLVWPLLREGRLPWSIAEALPGTLWRAAWIPFFFALAATALFAALRSLRGARVALPVAAAAFALHAVLLFVAVPAWKPAERETLEWIRRTWEPAPGRTQPLFGR